MRNVLLHRFVAVAGLLSLVACCKLQVGSVSAVILERVWVYLFLCVCLSMRFTMRRWSAVDLHICPAMNEWIILVYN